MTRLLATLLFATAPALAATWTWDGGAGNDDWTNSPNWVSNTIPTNDGTADIIFAGSTRLTPNLPVNWSVNSVLFDPSADVFILQSNNNSFLVIGDGGIRNADLDGKIINHRLLIAATQTWLADRGQLVINAPVVNNGSLLTLDTAFGNSIFLGGPISGSGNLIKKGSGSAQLSSTGNTFDGVTTVIEGILQLRSNAATQVPGQLDIGTDSAGPLATVENRNSNQIADTADVNVFSTGAWHLNDFFIISGPLITSSETITNLNISSAGVAGGGVVRMQNGALTILGTLSMAGGTVTTSAAGKVLLSGNLATNPSRLAASISSGLDLDGGPRNVTVADGEALYDLEVTGIVSNGALVKDGLGTIRLSAENTYAGGTTLDGGTLVIGHNAALGAGPVVGVSGSLRADGGDRVIGNPLSGLISIEGPFAVASTSSSSGDITKIGPGTLAFAADAVSDSLSVNEGNVRFDGPATFTNSLLNTSDVAVGLHTVTVNGAGLNNQDFLSIAGGKIAGSGPVINNGLIVGNGAIDGDGSFTNNAHVTVDGGPLTISKPTNTNVGSLLIPAGQQLRLAGGMLVNNGTIDLASGTIAGPSTLQNNPGGIISGRGLISAPLANAGGTLRPLGGTMHVANAFTNNGIIRLDDTAGLTGGAITNAGLIEGDGTVFNAVTNAPAGSLRANAGETLFIRGSFAPNAGELNLQGGTLDFTSPITNSAAGVITGRGALYTAGLTHLGRMQFSGGFTDIYGNVTLEAGSRLIVSGGSTTTFYDNFRHNGQEVRIAQGSRLTFFGAVSGAGSFTGPGTVDIEGTFSPGNSPANVQIDGDLNLGPEAILTMELAGLVPGSEHDRLAIGGLMNLAGALRISLLEGFTPAPGNSFDLFDGVLSGHFNQLHLPALHDGLSWDASALYTAGVLTVIPEPTGLGLLSVLIILGRRQPGTRHQDLA